MYLGGHVSISGGLDKSIDRIIDLGGNVIMSFASSPRSLTVKDFPPEQIEKYLSKKSKSKVVHHFFHGVYLVNLASPSRNYLKASMDSLIFYQRLAGLIGGTGTIIHIGSHKDKSSQDVLNQIVASINFILDSSPKDTKLILENAAGQGNAVGSKFEEISQIIARIGNRSKIGVCLDTQHAWASGIEMDTLVTRFDQIVGLKYLTAVHFNDSNSDFGSKVDRHANLGEGKIGLDLLKSIVRDPRLRYTPFILEVPGLDKSGPRKVDIDKLKSMSI